MRMFKGTILAGLLLAVSLLARVVVLQAQVAPAPADPSPSGSVSTGGNRNIGPHEAGNSPAITDKVSGLPVVVIVHPGENWAGKVGAWSSASPLVVRVTGITVSTTVAEAQAMGAQAATLPAGTIVVFGNELNNLDHEWKSRSVAPTPGSPECSHPVTNGEVTGAARAYAPLFAAFAAAAGSNVRVAPAPADMHNACYSGSVWMQAAAASGVYSNARALVANAYEAPEAGRTAQQDVDEVQAIAGRSVDFLTEFGPHPGRSVKDHLDFLNSTAPPNGLKAATLVPNRCGQPVNPGATQALPPTDMWLYYVNGELYNKGGQLVEVSEGNTCNSALSFPPPLVIPEANAAEWEKYLANSQVYCAPRQSFQPVLDGESPTLRVCIEHSNVAEQRNILGGFPVASRIVIGDQQCTGEEYPLIEGTETWDMSMLSFPLFRNDTGGISIEADLARVNPNDTFSEAAKRNSKPDYAPQFYLTSPEMQCKNAVNHLKYVQQICENYSQSEGAAGCALDSEVVFPDGTSSRLLALQNDLSDESVCTTIAQDMADPNNRRGLAVRAISTQTPKQFKLGFFVEHTYLHEPRGWPLGLFDTIGIKKIATWFSRDGRFPSTNQAPGETVDYIPIWYNAGLALSAYDEYLDGNGNVRAYNYDPATLPEKTDPSTLQPNANNFISGWNQTYSAVLPMHIQQRINADIRDTVKENWDLLKEKANSVGANADQPGVIIECVDKQCICYGDSTVEELATRGVGGEYVLSAATNCGALPMAAVAAAFPQSFQVPSRAFMYDLKQLIIGRVNSGVQRSVAFDPSKEAPADYRGPLTERSFEKCPADPEEYGIQETAVGITSSAFQQMQATGSAARVQAYEAEQGGIFSGPRQTITQIVHDFVAKINPTGEDIMSEPDGSPKQSSRAYLILPDEAMTIEKTQSYLAPMFFSPEMYASIMSGQNPIYPFNDRGATAAPDDNDLSAFLRTDGVGYKVDSEPAGYAVYQATIGYHNVSRVCTPSDSLPVPGALPETPPCTCAVDPNPSSTATGYLQNEVEGELSTADIAVGGSEVWIAYGNYPMSKTPTCGDPVSITLTEVKRSVVELEKRDAEDPNPETPGQLAAINEFMRRMAFLPLHMVQQYDGLENFYYGGGQAIPTPRPGSDSSGSGPDGSACDPEFLRPVFGALADKAACVARSESRNCSSFINHGCLNDGSNGKPRGTWDYSYGPFQINLLAHPAYSDIVPPELRRMWNESGVPEQVWSCSHAFNDPYDTGNKPDSHLDGTIGTASGGYMVQACRPGQKPWQVAMLKDCVEFFSRHDNSRDYSKMLLDRERGSWWPWSTSARICQLPAPPPSYLR